MKTNKKKTLLNLINFGANVTFKVKLLFYRGRIKRALNGAIFCRKIINIIYNIINYAHLYYYFTKISVKTIVQNYFLCYNIS